MHPQAKTYAKPMKRSLDIHHSHKPGALLASHEPFARHGINLLKIDSRPIHGTPWEYQFFLDVQADAPTQREAVMEELKTATSFLRILGSYPPARNAST